MKFVCSGRKFLMLTVICKCLSYMVWDLHVRWARFFRVVDGRNYIGDVYYFWKETWS